MSKICIKCGKDIPENSKEDVCEYCLNKMNGKIRKVIEILGGGLLSIVLLILTKGKYRGPRV
jgi:predicted nucleic acid-binding Zn ribbon protein